MRISLKELMKRCAHLLAPGTGSVEDRFVRKFMSLPDVLIVRKQSTSDRETSPPVMSVTRLLNFFQCLTRTKCGSSVAICLCAQFVAKKLPNKQHQQTQEACVWQASPQTELLQIHHTGDHLQSELEGGEGEEEVGSGQLEEEDRHPLSS